MKAQSFNTINETIDCLLKLYTVLNKNRIRFRTCETNFGAKNAYSNPA